MRLHPDAPAQFAHRREPGSRDAHHHGNTAVDPLQNPPDERARLLGGQLRSLSHYAEDRQSRRALLQIEVDHPIRARKIQGAILLEGSDRDDEHARSALVKVGQDDLRRGWLGLKLCQSASLVQGREEAPSPQVQGTSLPVSAVVAHLRDARNSMDENRRSASARAGRPRCGDGRMTRRSVALIPVFRAQTVADLTTGEPNPPA
jgi:hypothetical protein